MPLRFPSFGESSKAKYNIDAPLKEIEDLLGDLKILLDKHGAAINADAVNALKGLNDKYATVKKPSTKPSEALKKRAEKLQSDVEALKSRFDKQIFDAVVAESQKKGTLAILEKDGKLYHIAVQPHRVSRGGFGQVHLGTNAELGNVVLKRTLQESETPPEDKERRHLREAHIWQTLKHENILEFYGTCQVKEVLHIVSPYAANGTFLEYFQRNPDADRGQLLTDVASAMAYMHGKDVIHGDLRCANILVSPEKRAWLCDFGMSKGTGVLTSIGLKSAGCQFWMSPERLAADDGVPTRTKKDDVHSFGITIMEALDGKVPFDLNIRTTVFYEGRMDGSLQPDCGERTGYLVDVAKDCWQFSPDARPGFEEVKERLERGIEASAS